jgi:hypothetical protein
MLIASGVNIDAKLNIDDRKRCIPLHRNAFDMVLQYGNTAIAKLLLNYDEKPIGSLSGVPLTPELLEYHSSIFTPTALHAACYSNNIQALHDELDSGADIDLTNNPFDVRPLHIAIIKGHLNIVQVLVKRGADIFAVDTDGRTALHLATSFGQNEIIRFFLHALLGPIDDRIRHEDSMRLSYSVL